MEISSILKRACIVFLCSVLAAGAMYYEKSHVNVPTPQTGDMLYLRVIKFNEIPTLTVEQSSSEIDLTKLNNSWIHLSELEAQIDSDFDIRELAPKWDNLDSEQKRKWIGDHFRIEHIGPGMYELIINFSDKEAKNAQYIDQNCTKLMDDYAKSISEISRLITPNNEIETVRELKDISEKKTEPKGSIEKKYTIIGLVLGAVFGIVVIVAYDSRKRLKHQ